MNRYTRARLFLVSLLCYFAFFTYGCQVAKVSVTGFSSGNSGQSSKPATDFDFQLGYMPSGVGLCNTANISFKSSDGSYGSSTTSDLDIELSTVAGLTYYTGSTCAGATALPLINGSDPNSGVKAKIAQGTSYFLIYFKSTNIISSSISAKISFAGNLVTRNSYINIQNLMPMAPIDLIAFPVPKHGFRVDRNSFWLQNGQTCSDVKIYATSAPNNVNDNYNMGWGTLTNQMPTFGTGAGLLAYPVASVVDSSGNIYVVDTGNHRIQKFDSNGNFLSQFGSSGIGNGNFNLPRDMAIDSSGNIYVVDTGNHRIQKFDSSGAYITQFGSLGGGSGLFNLPSGIAIDSSGNIFISDTNNNRVQKFNSAGTYQSQFGAAGAGAGQFSNPQKIAINSAGDIFVADTGNHRIQKFSSGGTQLGSVGSSGTGNSQFSNPTGIAIDSSDNVFVADTFNNRVQKFNSALTFQASFGVLGYAEGQMDNPKDLSFDNSGNLLITDSQNSRILKYISDGTFLARYPSVTVKLDLSLETNDSSITIADQCPQYMASPNPINQISYVNNVDHVKTVTIVSNGSSVAPNKLKIKLSGADLFNVPINPVAVADSLEITPVVTPTEWFAEQCYEVSMKLKKNGAYVTNTSGQDIPFQVYFNTDPNWSWSLYPSSACAAPIPSNYGAIPAGTNESNHVWLKLQNGGPTKQSTQVSWNGYTNNAFVANSSWTKTENFRTNQFINLTAAAGLNTYVRDVYANGNLIYAATDGGMYKSTDGSTFSSTLVTGLVTSLSIDGSTFLAGKNTNLSLSTDSGTNFTAKTTSDGLASNWVLSALSANGRLYAGTINGLSVSSNGGTGFSTDPTLTSGSSINVFKLFFDGVQTVYAATSIGTYKSVNGATFTSVSGTPSQAVYVDSTAIYYGASSGLYFSTDGGTTWPSKTTSNGLGSNVVWSIRKNSKGTLFVGTANGISISTDNGNSFFNLTAAQGLGNNQIDSIFIDPNNGNVYLATPGPVGGVGVLK